MFIPRRVDNVAAFSHAITVVKPASSEPPRVAPPASGLPAPTEPAPRPPEPPRRLSPAELVRVCPGTVLVLATNVLVFLIAEHAGSTTRTDILIRFGASERSHLWAGEWWRLVTPMFLHVGWLHLVWNTVMMFSLCTTVERVFRTPRFLVLYLASGIGATAVSVLGHDAVSAGASGAGFGLIGVVMIVRRRMLPSWQAFFADGGIRYNLVSMGIWVVLGAATHAMDNFAHVGGLLWGALLTWVLTIPSPRARLGSFMAVAVVLAGTAAGATRQWPWQRSFWGGYQAEVAGEQALRESNPARAITEFDRAQALGIRAPELYFDRGLAHGALGHRAAALADFREVLRIAPPDAPYRGSAAEQIRLLQQP